MISRPESENMCGERSEGPPAVGTCDRNRVSSAGEGNASGARCAPISNGRNAEDGKGGFSRVDFSPASGEVAKGLRDWSGD